MSLIGTLNLASSALAVQQAALQVTGNNISNAGNADYTRQTATVTDAPDQQITPGIFVGTGVDITAVQRQIDDALTSRLRSSISDNESADQTQQWLGAVQATFNELTRRRSLDATQHVLHQLVGSGQQAAGYRVCSQVVIQNGQNVADFFQNLNGQLTSLQSDANDQMKALAGNADALAQQVATLNGQITVAEGGTGGTANGLRDARDAALKQLAQLVDIKTIPNATGSVVNVYVGSQPLVLNATNLGVGIKTSVVDNKSVSTVVFKANNGTMNLTGGQLGGLSNVQQQISDTVDKVDSLAGNLIFELNKAHASGQGLEGFSSTDVDQPLDDTTVPLNDPKSGLKYMPNNGSFVVHVTNKTTGLTTSTLVQVDLDGQNANDTSLDSLTADLNGIAKSRRRMRRRQAQHCRRQQR